MADYRDDVAALHARIEDLEARLAEARGELPGSARAAGETVRCPYCRRPMIAGSLVAGRAGIFRRDTGEEEVTYGYAGANPHHLCLDCSTVVLRGRFAD